ncbi:MAG: type II secretion system F family protein [candidate division Zixibacteria bacterium]|nr:type II secretion system F family protein [candidate division Zixibacteria bacterium]
MATSYTFTARSNQGKKITGVIQAHSHEQAIDSLLQQYAAIVRVAETRKPRSLGFALFRKSYLPELILFSRNLATYYRSGIPLTKALSIIKISKADGKFQKVLAEIREDVIEGRSLSTAMSKHSDIFPAIMTSAVEAGETSGKLAEILEQSASALERELALKRQIKSSVRYPAIVVGMIGVAFLVLIGFAVPTFVEFYGKFGAELPASTRALIWISNIVSHYWALVLILMACASYFIRQFYRTESGRKFFDMIILKTPVFGELLTKAAVARFAMLFVVLHRAGIPIVTALGLLETSMKNIHLREEVIRLRESFREGRELDIEFIESSYFPEMALNMIKAGLETGSLDTMLDELGAHYSRDVEYTSQNLASIIEPLLTVLVGATVLVLALAIFLPMWNLIKVFH